MSMQATTFVDDEVLSNLGGLSRAQVDALPYGAVKVDEEGTVLLYNRYESELAGVEPSDAEGQIFFTEVAPCTNNRMFFGKFEEGVEAGELDEVFNYTFTYRMSPTLVSIHMRHDADSDANWIFVKKS